MSAAHTPTDRASALVEYSLLRGYGYEAILIETQAGNAAKWVRRARADDVVNRTLSFADYFAIAQARGVR